MLRLVGHLKRWGALTPEGRRIRRQDEVLSLREQHVEPGARGFLDGLGFAELPEDRELENRWRAYRELYDIRLTPWLDPYRGLLLRYSPRRTLVDALEMSIRFPGLLHKLLETGSWAPDPERELLEELQGAQGASDLRERARCSPRPDRLLQGLAFLDHSPVQRLEAAAWLWSRLEGLGLGDPRVLARAVHTPPDVLAVCALPWEMRSPLAQAMLTLAGGSTCGDQVWGLAGLRFVGDEGCLPCLNALVTRGSPVTFGPRPGRSLLGALAREAERCIGARTEHMGLSRKVKG